MSLYLIGHAMLFQILWFTCVLDAENMLIWPELICLSCLYLWGVYFKHSARKDLSLMIIGVFIAYLAEPVWISQDVIAYPSHSNTITPPIWITVLWAGFALSFNHSLSWLKLSPAISCLVGIVGSLISISAAIRLGSVQAPQGWLFVILGYCSIWGVIVPGLAYLTHQQGRQKARRNDLALGGNKP